MWSYIINRLFTFIPSLIGISLIAFGLSLLVPGDPIQNKLDSESFAETLSGLDDYEKSYLEMAKSFGLNKPTFFFSFSSQAYPDTLYSIYNPTKSNVLFKLVGQYGNWPQIQAYYDYIYTFQRAVLRVKEAHPTNNSLIEIKKNIDYLFANYKDDRIQYHLNTITSHVQQDSVVLANLGPSNEKLNGLYTQVKNQASTNLLYWPEIKWHSWDNQYSSWISKFFIGDFGVSYFNGEPVRNRILSALFWTVLISGISIFLAFLISIPLGVYTAVYQDSTFDKITSITLFAWYSLPNFWIATLLIIFFTNNYYGMKWFPTSGVRSLLLDPNASLGTQFWDTAHHLVLPIICMTYPALAFLTRQMRSSMLDALNKDFIRTARAKGLSPNKVIWKHAFYNASFPIITIGANILPSLITGSVIIEYIFNINGLGRMMLTAISQQDWPVVYTLLMLGAILTMLGILIADLLYAAVDPRINLGKKRT